jgi:hypothetical protein
MAKVKKFHARGRPLGRLISKPVDTRELARLAGVSHMTAYRFFDREQRKRIRPPTLRALQAAEAALKKRAPAE